MGSPPYLSTTIVRWMNITQTMEKDRYRRIVDDVVIYDSDITQHASHVKEFLQRCAERKITLNQTKWTFAQPQVTFAGFILSADGYKVDSSITDAISRFPTPSNRTNLRSFFGLVNQLSASSWPPSAALPPPQRLCTYSLWYGQCQNATSS